MNNNISNKIFESAFAESFDTTFEYISYVGYHLSKCYQNETNYNVHNESMFHGIDTRSVAFIISELDLQMAEQPVHQVPLLWVSFKASISSIVISMTIKIKCHIYIS